MRGKRSSNGKPTKEPPGGGQPHLARISPPLHLLRLPLPGLHAPDIRGAAHRGFSALLRGQRCDRPLHDCSSGLELLVRESSGPSFKWFLDVLVEEREQTKGKRRRQGKWSVQRELGRFSDLCCLALLAPRSRCGRFVGPQGRSSTIREVDAPPAMRYFFSVRPAGATVK